MALRTRSKSTYRRTTSSGSVTLIAPGSHVTNLAVQAMSGMWTVRSVTSGGMSTPTEVFWRVFPPLAGVPPGARPGSARADPAERRLGSGARGRLMLAVAPAAAWALLVVPLPAGNADHALYCAAYQTAMGPNGPCCLRHVMAPPATGVPAPSSVVCCPQAAFARRIRRRRSAERSSSFSPPHVPYFSGRDTA
jgi:hypothetical protein